MLLAYLLAIQLAATRPELPPSPAARAWASVGLTTRPTSLEAELLKDEGWLTDPRGADPARRWSRWGQWIAAEREQEQADARRRAGLLAIAASEERWEDAWAHFARLGAEPEWAAALLPHLLPGLPLAHGTDASGRPAPLEDGAVLRPAIPPAPADAPPGSLRHRVASYPGLAIGAAIVDLRITIEPSGVQVDLLHKSGGAARVAVLLPEPAGHRIKVEYIDWMRQDVRREPLMVELLPDTEEHNLFGRFTYLRDSMPAVPTGALGVSLKRGGVWFECEEESEIAKQAAPFAAALAQLFEMPTGLCTPGELPPESPWSQTVCRLPGGPVGLARLLKLTSLAERYALGDQR